MKLQEIFHHLLLHYFNNSLYKYLQFGKMTTFFDEYSYQSKDKSVASLTKVLYLLNGIRWRTLLQASSKYAYGYRIMAISETIDLEAASALLLRDVLLHYIFSGIPYMSSEIYFSCVLTLYIILYISLHTTGISATAFL